MDLLKIKLLSDFCEQPDVVHIQRLDFHLKH